MYIVNKDKVLPSQAYVTIADFGYPVYALWLSFYQKLLKYSAFPGADPGFQVRGGGGRTLKIAPS